VRFVTSRTKSPDDTSVLRCAAKAKRLRISFWMMEDMLLSVFWQHDLTTVVDSDIVPVVVYLGDSLGPLTRNSQVLDREDQTD
jgi:hypothetical protein